MAKAMNEFRCPTNAARQRSSCLGQLRGEGLPLAPFVSTLPALDAKLHGHTRGLRRQVLQMTLMPAVPVRRLFPAVWTHATSFTDRQNHPLAMNLFRARNSYAEPRSPS